MLPAVYLEPARLEQLAEEMLYQAALLNPPVEDRKAKEWFATLLEDPNFGAVTTLFVKDIAIGIPDPEFLGVRPFNGEGSNLLILNTRAVVRVVRDFATRFERVRAAGSASEHD